MRSPLGYIIVLFFILSTVILQSFVYAQATDQEKDKLLMVFNQPAYAPGDTAYFTGYLSPFIKKQIVSIKLFGAARELVHHGRIVFQNGVGSGQILIPQNLQSGNYQLVGYAEESGFPDSRLFYFGHLTISSVLSRNIQSAGIVEDTLRINISTDQDKYSRRSKVKVSVDFKGIPKSSSVVVSAAVFNEQLFIDKTGMKLTSIINCVAINKSPDKLNAFPTLSDFPDYFQGKAIITSSGQSVPDSSKITFYLNKNDFAYVTYTQAQGNFTFPLFNNFGDELVFYKVSHKGIEIKDSKIILHEIPIGEEQINVTRNDTLSAYGVYARQKQFVDRSYHYFASKESADQSTNRLVNDVETDKEILLEKFEPFPSMADVFSNIVPTVRYRKNGMNESIRIFLERTAKYGASDPIYIVNGRMTDDTRYVLSLDPKFVRKIGVLRSQETLARFGDLGLEGMLLIETDLLYQGEVKSTHTFSVTGISKAIGFSQKGYHQSNVTSRLPDLRSTLYWNPNLDLTKERSFDFYTCDDIGYYIIQIAGIIDGKPFFSTKRFYVESGAD